ncbi:MAG: DEAD/DEAH box helicase family protein [Myxococcota bacterium]
MDDGRSQKPEMPATFPLDPPAVETPMIQLHFQHGTLVAPAMPADAEPVVGRYFVHDERTDTYRAAAHCYRDVVLHLKAAKLPFDDRARQFERIALQRATEQTPFPHQKEALDAWWAAGGRGIVELPTGAGKTFVAVLAIAKVMRPALVVVPTIDLMVQWQKVLAEHLNQPVGVVGGGEKDRQSLTVTTYDSAAAQVEFHGDKFGLMVCDECHHLPAPGYRFIAEGSLAPFRLGLTATLARQDGGEAVAAQLLGPLVHKVPIDALEGDYLAPYEVRSIQVTLTDEEQSMYDECRQRYLTFLRQQGIQYSRPSWWSEFIMRAHRSAEGRAAFDGYRVQRRIALTGQRKLEALWKILMDHRDDRVIVFTEDTEMVYTLAQRFFLPGLTHHTRPAERKRLLEEFAAGQTRVLVTAKVLNEGVDVPEANVGVVLSGNGSVREHVQRLGRILRKRPDKQAVLYEVFTDVAAEAGISERRRQHAAYARADET